MTVDYSNMPEIPCPLCGSESCTELTVRFDSGRIVRCSACGHSYLNPTLSDGALSQYYQENYYAVDGDSDSESLFMQTCDGWFKDAKGPYQYALGFLESHGGISSKRVLDVGCGPGRFLYECYSRGAHVTGIEMDERAVRLAKQYFDLSLIQKTAEEAERERIFDDSTFDVVFAFELIEHLRNPTSLLLYLSRLLVPGGFLLLSTPNFYLFELMGRSAPSVSQWTEHLQFFDPSSIRKYVEQASLEIVAVATINPLTHAERRKQQLARITSINNAWQSVRRIPLALFLKNVLFRLLNSHKHTADTTGWNGTSIVCLARKPLCVSGRV